MMLARSALLGLLATAFLAPTADAASPVSAHAMVHTCCTPAPMKERIFTEAKALGANFIRVDVELHAIFGAPDAEPDWSALDEVMALSKKHDLPVLGILLKPPAGSDEADFGRLSGEVAEHAARTIHHWEIVNEPDGAWAFDGTPEQYARMLSAAFDEIKGRVPSAQVLFGGLMRPHELGWLDRVLATPGADAIRKFDIANVHLRGPSGAVVRRLPEFRSALAARGFSGPVWVTEHGYPADPAFQVDPQFAGGDPSQAAYLTETLVGLGEMGAPQVFVTLRDNLEGEYATEGLVHIDEAAGYAAVRRPSFEAVRRLTHEWDQVMAWRREQREHEQALRVSQASALLAAGEARTARAKFAAARLEVHALQKALARPRRRAAVRLRLTRRLERARAVLAGRRMALLWDRASTRWYRDRVAEHSAAASELKARIAGG